tara:strand:- start:9023 stop:9310 length:288 start_codon:yes stop_codon:yes gene_type:complete
MKIDREHRNTDKGIKFPCWHNGQWCWCTSNSRHCKARGVKIRDFSGSSSEKYSNHPGFLGSSVSTLSILGWSLGALAILFVVGKGVKIYKDMKTY